MWINLEIASNALGEFIELAHKAIFSKRCGSFS